MWRTISTVGLFMTNMSQAVKPIAVLVSLLRNMWTCSAVTRYSLHVFTYTRYWWICATCRSRCAISRSLVSASIDRSRSAIHYSWSTFWVNRFRDRRRSSVQRHQWIAVRLLMSTDNRLWSMVARTSDSSNSATRSIDSANPSIALTYCPA